MSEKNLEQIIKQKFEGALTEVPSSAWSGIESQIGGVTATGVSSLSVLAKIFIGASVAASIITASILFQRNNEPTVKDSAIASQENKEESSHNETHKTSNSADFKEKSTISKPENKKPSVKHSDISKPEQTQSLVELENNLLDEAEEISNDLEKLEAQSETLTEQNQYTEEYSEESQEDQSVVLDNHFIIPHKILALELKNEPVTYRFKLDKIDPSSEISWYIDDVFITSETELMHEFESDAEVTVMALIHSEDKQPISLFKDLTIELPLKLVMPNVFSPNSDAINPTFMPVLEECSKIYSYSMSILNTSGEFIYTSTENNASWDGNLSDGSPAPIGTYFYIVIANSENGQSEKKSDSFKLLR